MEKNILIVVDMQNGFARYPQTISLKNDIENLLDRKIFDSVIATKFINTENSIYERLFAWHRLQSADEQKIPELIEKHADYIVEKNVYNCMSESFLDKLCEINDGKKPDKVFIIGADTDCCVLTIATALFEKDIRPIVLTRYCNSNGGPESHKAGLLCLKRLIGQNQLSDTDPKTKEDLYSI